MRYLRPRSADRRTLDVLTCRPVAQSLYDAEALLAEARRCGRNAKVQALVDSGDPHRPYLAAYYARLAARFAFAALAYRNKENPRG